QASLHALLLETQAEAVAVEPAAVHAATGVARLAVAGADAGLEHGVRIRRPAERGIRVPLVPGRGHAPARAVGVVARFGAVGGEPRVHRGIARGRVEHLVVAAVAGDGGAAVQAHAGRVEVRDRALEADR